MLKTRPLVSLRIAQRSIHVSRSRLEDIAKKNSEPSVHVLKKRKARTTKPSAPIPDVIVEKVVLPEHRILAQVREVEQSTAITLEDVERYRPSGHPPRTDSPRYEKRYQAIASNIRRSFNKDQVYKILGLYEIVPPSTSRSKDHLVELLLQKWGWPPVELERSKKRLVQRDLSLKLSEAFLILNDTRNIIRQARESGIRLEYTREALKLRLEGKNTAVEDIISSIDLFKQGISEHTMFIPFTAVYSDAQLEDISRASGTFVDRVDESHLRISYLKTSLDSLSAAKQVIMKTGYANVSPSHDSLFAFVSTGGEDALYFLYPFSPVQASFGIKGDADTYRMSGHGSGSLAPTTFDTLRKWLEYIRDDASKLTIDATLGHKLYQNSHKSTNPFTLRGGFDLKNGVEKIQDGLPAAGAFYPSVPKSVLELPTLSSQTYQRIVYGAINGSAGSSSQKTHRARMLRFMIAPDISENSLICRQYPDLVKNMSSESLAKAAGLKHTLYGLCEEGWKQDADLLLPDCPIDMRITASQMTPRTPPTVLQTYLEQMNEGAEEENLHFPEPPLYLGHGDDLYVLISSQVVRGGIKELHSESLAPSKQIFTEIALDTQSKRSEASCHTTVPSDGTNEDWKQFIQQATGLIDLVPPLRNPDSLVAWP